MKTRHQTNQSKAFTLVEHMSVYDSTKRKWLKDSTGEWCRLTPQGTLVRRGIPMDFNATVWDEPKQLVGINFLVIRDASAADDGTYQCRVSNNVDSVDSANALLKIASPP